MAQNFPDIFQCTINFITFSDEARGEKRIYQKNRFKKSKILLGYLERSDPPPRGRYLNYPLHS